MSKTLLAKSLYNNKKTRSLKVKGQSPGPGHYNPIMDTFDLKWKLNKYKGEDAVFQSIVPRFKKSGKGMEVPGPGKYFKDEYYIDYNDNYNPYGVTIGTSNFKGPVLSKGRNDWFEYVRVKRNLIDHRYIFFLFDDNENDCTFEFEDYIRKSNRQKNCRKDIINSCMNSVLILLSLLLITWMH